MRMSTYQPLLDSNKEFEVATTSSTALQTLDELTLRAPMRGTEQREQLATNYGHDSIEEALEAFGYDQDDMLTPPEFYRSVAPVVFEGVDESDVEDGVNVGEVRRGMMDFSSAGQPDLSELINT
jgi:hypothetical protein